MSEQTSREIITAKAECCQKLIDLSVFLPVCPMILLLSLLPVLSVAVLPTSMYACRLACLSYCPSVYWSVCLSASLSCSLIFLLQPMHAILQVCFPVTLLVFLLVIISVCLFVCLSFCQSVCRLLPSFCCCQTCLFCCCLACRLSCLSVFHGHADCLSVCHPVRLSNDRTPLLRHIVEGAD
jgi:hypothetical protein